MCKIPVADLVLLAAPPEKHTEVPDRHDPQKEDANIPTGTPGDPPVVQPNRPKPMGSTEDGTAGEGDAKRSGVVSSPSEPKVSAAMSHGGMSVTQRARHAARGDHGLSTRSVRLQLELLGDLCHAVGHGEGTLVCSSLLRDEVAVMTILR